MRRISIQQCRASCEIRQVKRRRSVEHKRQSCESVEHVDPIDRAVDEAYEKEEGRTRKLSMRRSSFRDQSAGVGAAMQTPVEQLGAKRRGIESVVEEVLKVSTESLDDTVVGIMDGIEVHIEREMRLYQAETQRLCEGTAGIASLRDALLKLPGVRPPSQEDYAAIALKSLSFSKDPLTPLVIPETRPLQSIEARRRGPLEAGVGGDGKRAVGLGTSLKDELGDAGVASAAPAPLRPDLGGRMPPKVCKKEKRVAAPNSAPGRGGNSSGRQASPGSFLEGLGRTLGHLLSPGVQAPEAREPQAATLSTSSSSRSGGGSGGGGGGGGGIASKGSPEGAPVAARLEAIADDEAATAQESQLDPTDPLAA